MCTFPIKHIQLWVKQLRDACAHPPMLTLLNLSRPKVFWFLSLFLKVIRSDLTFGYRSPEWETVVIGKISWINLLSELLKTSFRFQNANKICYVFRVSSLKTVERKKFSTYSTRRYSKYSFKYRTRRVFNPICFHHSQIKKLLYNLG